MGTFATRYRWRGWQFFMVILAAAWALDMGQLHLQMVVEAAISLPPLRLSAPPGLPPLSSITAPPGLPPLSSITVPPGLPPLSSITVPPGLPPLPPNLANSSIDSIRDQINNLTNTIVSNIEKSMSFCIISSDPQNTFNTSTMENILYQCERDAGPDFSGGVCGKSEIDLYLANVQYLKTSGIPSNGNCNSTHWPTACNPGWAGIVTTASSLLGNESFDPKTASSLPGNKPVNPNIGVSTARSCCAGFFCPGGLTCMIPCPLGAYCPLATFDPWTSTCLPYGYPGSPKGNAQCGGADVWLNIKDSPAMFCSAGQYCQDAITQTPCTKGHFCRAGSTAQTKCGFLIGCYKDGLKSGNMKTQGILLVVLLCFFLLLIYTCSDQVMHIRERRKSKALDIAAQQAKARISALERWKKAKAAALTAGKKVVTLTGDLGKTLSKTLSMVSSTTIDIDLPELHEIEAQPLSGNQQHPADPMISTEWQGDEELRKGVHQFHQHDNPSEDIMGSSQDDWSIELHPYKGPQDVDLDDAVQPPKVLSGVHNGQGGLKKSSGGRKKLAHTRSKIYKYAYGQIEKEKVSEQSKTMSSLREVVESEAFREMVIAGQRKLQIELSFVDLCLILKGSGKKILSYVTGKLSPGRVTAVMGPSGAGKTTFLNAIAGKETGSVITGQVFINGVPGSIQAYKRIIGFVPQDDIVHGSLTVEENLTFSAKYRLPMGTPRQERVLVVERTINRLNLTPIRNSLVGTVEKRGISGGQRKRVNLGLELVIEPSLLILDEPTSGLDSTSSRLVVQSLRREASLGVNVCLVVHQPSYGLFCMFDDIMLLAKGGYTVYMGPVVEIEAYFSSLGFEVPDRTNPPDYFMDILEGVTAPEDDPSFDLKSLPVLWMCHNCYHIPLELQETAGGRTIIRDESVMISYDVPKTLTQEIWDELRIYILVRLDILETSFFRVKNMSGRQTPGFFPQYFLILKRVTLQRFREYRLIAQDYLILLLAGICLGFLAGWDDTAIVEQAYTYTLITVALLIMIASLRTFTSDKLQFWRESSSGIHRLSFFLAKDTVDLFNTVLKPVVYLSMFYFFNNPRSSFTANYITTLALVYCCTGIGYVVSILLRPQPGQLFCVFLPVLATLIVSEPRTGLLNDIGRASYSFWALQAYTIANAKEYSGVWLLQRCQLLGKYGYDIRSFNLCIGVLLLYGVGTRIIAFICLILVHKKQQK